MPPETPSPPPLPPCRPQGVRAVKHRRPDGSTVTYWYCRLTGARLPDPADPAFAAAIAAARKQPAARYAPGSLGELLADWRGSPEYRATSVTTQRNRERYVAALDAAEWSCRPVVGHNLEDMRQLRADLLKLRDLIATHRGAGAASVFGQTVATLFSWAVGRGRMVLSPLARLPAMRLGHIPTYTEAQAQHAMTAWPEPERRAAVLAYWIGQRRGDLAALRWDQYDIRAGVIRLQPQKTRRRREAKGLGPLVIPVPPVLRLELARWRREAPEATHILTSSTGRPWSYGGLINVIRRRLKAEGWDTKAGLHGLRKRSAEVLAEHGASASEIAAARGWDTLGMVELYTRGADQEKMARAAIRRLSKPLSKVGKKGA